MAKAKTTTDTKTLLCDLEDEAHAEVFGLGHVSALMVTWGEEVSAPGKALSDMEMQAIGLRIEYLGGLVKRHAEAIGSALVEIRTAAEHMEGDAA
jgi:hypothetical protein